jgi:nucleoside 2-deoxyribosyltransferase
MNRLANSRCYLAGAMDRVKDGGVEWRKRLRESLADLKVFWLDPTNKPINIGREDLVGRVHRRECKRAGDFDIVKEEMRQIRAVDLGMVDRCDFLIVNIDTEVHACGTYEEVFWANRIKRPIIVHVEQGKQDTPDWLLGALPHELIFSTWTQVTDYIRHIAHDEVIDTMRRWYFFDWMRQC